LRIFSETTRNSPSESRLYSLENRLGSPKIVSPVLPKSTRRKNRHRDRPESRLWPIGDAQYHPPEDRVSAGFLGHTGSLSLGDLPLCFSLWLSRSLFSLFRPDKEERRITKRERRGSGHGFSGLVGSRVISNSFPLSVSVSLSISLSLDSASLSVSLSHGSLGFSLSRSLSESLG
jgi:hypothetical protein